MWQRIMLLLTKFRHNDVIMTYICIHGNEFHGEWSGAIFVMDECYLIKYESDAEYYK